MKCARRPCCLPGDGPSMEVSKELRADIESNQGKLKTAIRSHQLLVLKLKADPDNDAVKFEIKAAQNDIISIGLDQKELIERIRREIKLQQKSIKTNSVKAGLEEKRCHLANILTKTRKQTLTSRSASVSPVSTSEDSLDAPHSPLSPAPPLLPHELSQVEFLGRMGLCTPDVFKELQNKRVERKRRSTANPQFLYGNRWDQTTKRKKSAYLISMSPPNTRQAVKNKMKAEQRNASPPHRTDSRSSSPVHKKAVPVGLNIPNLPSGLTIERINGNKQPPDAKVCLVCRTAGALTVCDTCNGCFHVGCHNRPLVQQPRQCPKCLGKRDNGSRDVGSLSVPPSMTVLTTYVSAKVKEKAQEKRQLIEKNSALKTELNQLEDRAERLTVSLKDQADTRDEILNVQRDMERKLQRLLDFITVVKGEPRKVVTAPSPSASPSPRALSSPSPTTITTTPSPTPAVVEIVDGS